MKTMKLIVVAGLIGLPWPAVAADTDLASSIRQQGDLAVAAVRADLERALESNLRAQLVPRAGVEPATFPLGGGRSIQLSYRGDRRILTEATELP